MTETKPAGRQERRKAATRTKIVDAAEELFCANGDATLEQIADLADVAVATVYAHFSGKREIHYAVVERALSENERHLLAVYESDAAPFDRLVDAAAAYLRFYRESPQRFRLVALRLAAPTRESTDADAMMAQRVDAMTDALTALIADGVADGSLRPVSPPDAARFFWGSMNGVLALALRPDPLRLTGDQLAAVVSTGLQVVFEGLAGDALRDRKGRLLPLVNARIDSVITPALR